MERVHHRVVCTVRYFSSVPSSAGLELKSRGTSRALEIDRLSVVRHPAYVALFAGYAKQVFASPIFANSSRDLTPALEADCAGWLHPQVQQWSSPRLVARQWNFHKMRLTTAIFAVSLVKDGAEFPVLSARVPRCIRVTSDIPTTTTGANNFHGAADRKAERLMP
jgi:hypothetical protein